MLKSITVELISSDNIISGLFRSLLSVAERDILVIGNKKASLFFTFSDIEIKKVMIRHTDLFMSKDILAARVCNMLPNDINVLINMVNKEKIITETYNITNKQQSFSLLTHLYKNNSKIIKGSTVLSLDTDNYDIETAYTVLSSDEKCVIEDYRVKEYNKCETLPGLQRQRKNFDPALTSSNSIKTFLNKILRGHKYEQDNWKQGYAGQLSNSS